MSGTFSPEELAALEDPTPSGTFSPEELAALEDPAGEAPAAAKQDRIGALGAGAAGAVSGATLGFDDELAGAAGASHAIMSAPGVLAGKAAAGIKNLFGGNATAPEFENPLDAYRRDRDTVRDLHKVAKEDHPTAHLVGEIGGGVASGFIPGLGAAKGASVAKMAGKAALEGAASGFGNSEATDAVGLAKDIGTGALVGGVTTGAVGGALRSAPGRAISRAVGDLTDGVPARLRDRLSGKAGSKVAEVYDIVQSTPGLRKAGSDAGAVLKAVEPAIEDTGAKLNHIYAKAGDATPGIAKHRIANDIDAIASKLEKNPGTIEAADAVRKKVDNVLRAWADADYVSPQQVREFASEMGAEAFAGSPAMGFKKSQEISREIWGALKDRIDENIDEAAKKLGGQGSKELRALNKRMNNLMEIRAAATYKATREATPSTKLKDRANGALNMFLGANAAVGNVGPLAGKLALQHVGIPAVKATDNQVARIVLAAQKGSTAAELALRAVEWGVAPSAAKELATWARSQYGATGERD